ncbi:MAG: HAD-IIIA family hydrolase [Saprospiraceae bacterium]|nr:HAD-IIIA family hydrolase [Saprospiraceae bacterium]
MTKKTLFLDRDGVINKRIVGGYVKNWEQFNFLAGVLEAMPLLARKFDYCFVVTNQQGIGKGLMTVLDLETVHNNMLFEITKKQGLINKVYFCPKLHIDKPHCRKPNIGMAEQAKLDFPDINFKNSFMVGDSVSDMEFGFRLNMKTVFIDTKKDIDANQFSLINKKIDYCYSSLYEFALSLD